MKGFKNKISWIIIFSLIIAFILPVSTLAGNEESQTYSVKVRIEGDESTFVPPTTVEGEGVEEVPTIVSIDQVNEIQVDYGTAESNVLSLLPKTTNINDSLGQEHVVSLNWSIENYSSDNAGSYTAIGSFELPDGVEQTEPETKLEISTKIVVREKTVASKNLDEAIDKVIHYYEKNNPSDPDSEWEAFVGLWSLGKVLNREYNWESVDPGFGASINGNETLRYGYSLLGLGHDISNVWGGRNLYAELASQQKDGSFYTFGKDLFAVLLLDAGEKIGADVGGWNKESKEKAIDHILSQQNEDGSFYYFSHLDYTGWALIVLSNYQGQEKVDVAIKKAVDFLKASQGDNGGFEDTGMWGSGENANSNACVIQGLVAIGEDLLSPDSPWIKNGNTVVDGLLKFQQEDGSFWWEENSQGNVVMATKQALVALSDLKHEKSTWHRLADEISLPSTEKNNVEEINLGISNLPSFDKLTFDHKQDVMKIYNMYLQLSEEYKEQIIDLDKLIKAKERVDQLESTIKSINDAIWGLPGDVNEITLEHKSAVLNIIEAYEKLSSADKKHIEYYQEVLDAKAAIEKLEITKEEDLSNKDTGGSVSPEKDNSQSLEVDSDENGKNENDINQGSDNKLKEDNSLEEKSNNPKTGDQYLFIPLLLLFISLASLAGLYFSKYKVKFKKK